MTKETAINMLSVAKTGDEMLQVLNTLVAGVAGFNYVESPMIEQTLGVPTLEPMEF